MVWHAQGPHARDRSSRLREQGRACRRCVRACISHAFLDHVYKRTDPGRAVNDRPLNRLPWSAVFPYTIASPAIGAATGALELFIENNREHVSAAGGRTVSASPGLHLLAEVEAARTRLALTWRDFHARVTRGEEMLRTRCRYYAALGYPFNRSWGFASKGGSAEVAPSWADVRVVSVVWEERSFGSCS